MDMKKFLKVNIAKLMVFLILLTCIQWYIPQYKVYAASYNNIDYSDKAKQYRILQQTDTDCGIASIASIEAYWRESTVNTYNDVYKSQGAYEVTSWGNAGYSRIYKFSEETLYNALKSGPVIIHTQGSGSQRVHFSVVVGYKGSTTNLEHNGFLVMLIYRGSSIFNSNYSESTKIPLDDYEAKFGKADGIAIRGKGLGSASSPASVSFSNTYTTDITETSAKIVTDHTMSSTMSDCGFYLGTTNNISSMTKTSEYKYGGSSHGYTYGNLSYKLGTWYDDTTGYKWSQPLRPGTTYYYAFYIVLGGKEFISDINSFQTIDTTPPVISNINVSNVTADGYTVSCQVTDNGTVSRVCFPTWTVNNGQDDLVSDWYNNAAVYTSNGNTYSYRVNVSDHNNEGGQYITYIYAYDAAGNNTCDSSTSVNIVRNVPLTSYTLSQTSMSLYTNEKGVLKVSDFTPANTTSDKTAIWKSDNASVATIDSSGIVTAVKEGTAKITCTVAGISKTCTITVLPYDNNKFSAWMTALPEAVKNNPDNYIVKERTEYRSRTKSETTSTSSSLSGWQKSGETWGNWQSCGSDVTGTATREVKQESNYVKTQYSYNHWHNYNNGNISPVQYTGWVYHETGWLDSPLTASGTSNAGGTKYASSTELGACGYKTYWYNEQKQDVYDTKYYYRDKIFSYYKWSDWSSWSTDVKQSNSNTEVEKRVTYSYLKKVADNIILKDDSVEIMQNDSYMLVYNLFGDLKDSDITWSSSNENIAVVEKYNNAGKFVGKITGKGVGTAVITASALNGTIKAKCNVTITARTTIDVDKTYISIAAGDKVKINATVNPANVGMTWKSADTNIATIDSQGYVTGISKGRTVIVISSNDKVYTAQVTVNVTEPYITSVAIKTQPEKNRYYVGQSIDTKGLTLNVKYSNGTEKNVTSGFGVEADTSTVGSKTVIIVYEGYTCRYNVTVTEPMVTEISIKSKPNKLVYNVGESLSTKGLVLNVKYENNIVKEITEGFEATADLMAAGTKNVTIKYCGLVTTYTVTVNNVEKPTQAPTEAPTEKPTQVPTEAPTEKPTQAPTEAPMEKPTQHPSETDGEYAGDVNTELQKFNYDNNTNYISGQIIVVEWVDVDGDGVKESTVPKYKPTMQFVSTDGTETIDVFVTPTGTNTYYFDRRVSGFTEGKEYVFKVTSGNPKNISKYKTVPIYTGSSEIGMSGKLGVVGTQELAYSTSVDGTLRLFGKTMSGYIGNVNSLLTNVNYGKSVYGDFITGNIIVTEWINGNSTVPRTTPKMTFESTDGTEINEVFMKCLDGTNTYYFDRNLNGKVDTSKEYIFRISLTEPNNISVNSSMVATTNEMSAKEGILWETDTQVIRYKTVWADMDNQLRVYAVDK